MLQATIFMAISLERNPSEIRGEVDIRKIGGTTERWFVRLVLARNPHLQIFYESQFFQSRNGNGQKEGTVPDFYIYNPRTGRGTYVEITTSRRHGNGGDPKGKQKRVMQAAALGERYVVLYRENLEKMQDKYPQFNLL